MLAERFVRIGLGEHVGGLIFAVDCIDRNLASVNVVPEMMVLNVDVLSSGANLGHRSDLNCAAVVFKNATVDGWLGAAKSKAQLMEFLDRFHDGDGCAEDHTETNEFAFCRAEHDFGLQLGCPMKWAAGIHDDVAVSGASGVGVLHIVPVPVAGKVCVNINIEGGAGGSKNQTLVPCHLEVLT